MRFRVLLILMPCLFLSSKISASDASFRAWINVTEAQAGVFLIQSFCQSPTSSKIKYVMTTTKSGFSGTANSSQSGAITLSQNQATPLSKIKLKGLNTDNFNIDLKVFHQNKLVTETQHNHP